MLVDDIRRELAGITDAHAAMTRTIEILKRERLHYTWAGIYLLEGDELVLGPYLGKPSPHTRIPLGRGICGAAASQRATIIVDDVNSDPRYLACSIDTRSEIVVPILRGGMSGGVGPGDVAPGGMTVLGEIDIDSDTRAAFGPADRELLEAVAAIHSEKL
jgi:GAF domain-containing protein